MKRRKALGQNFLINDRAARTIVDLFNPRKKDLVIEIGPGRGALTRYLAVAGTRLCAIEKDRSLADLMAGHFQQQRNVRIVSSDILARSFRDFCSQEGFPREKIRIIGNLPYSISKPVLMKIMEERADICDFMLMLQQEVAEKLTAKPGTKQYSPLTVLFSLTAKIREVMKLAPGSFSPPPKIRSAVIHGSFLEQARFDRHEEPLLRKLLAALFARRRKTIGNNMKLLRLEDGMILEALDSCKVDPGMRAEALSPEAFLCLTRFINMKGNAALL